MEMEGGQLEYDLDNMSDPGSSVSQKDFTSYSDNQTSEDEN